MLRNAGGGLRLAVASRMDPLLPLHRWRLGGQLTEIGTSDLAFSTEEASLLLAPHGCTLPADALESLMRPTACGRTEVGGMRTLTTGLAGQQQLRSARRGGPDQAVWSPAARSSAALPAALGRRRGNLILVDPASGRGECSPELSGCSLSPALPPEGGAGRPLDG